MEIELHMQKSWVRILQPSHIVLRVELLLNSEIKHYDWLLQVMWQV